MTAGAWRAGGVGGARVPGSHHRVGARVPGRAYDSEGPQPRYGGAAVGCAGLRGRVGVIDIDIDYICAFFACFFVVVRAL